MIPKGRGRLLRIGKKEIADGHPVDEYNNEVLCRLTPLQQKEVGIPAFYIRLTVFLGWCGAHRFLEHRWKLGIFYLLVGWTGLGLAFALVDLLIALPIAKDENGMIEI